MGLRAMILAALAATALCGAVSAQVTPLPGDLLAIDYITGPTLIRYNQAGTQLQSITLTGTGPVGSIVGIAWLNGVVYINGTSGRIGTINLATGAYTDGFAASGNEGLGRSGANLVSLTFGNPSVATSYTTGGSNLGSVNLTGSTGSTGIDADATGWWLADYGSGLIRKFSFAGVQQSSFNPGLGTNTLSDLSYDAATDTLWVADGFGGADRIYHFTTAGTLLGSFPTTGFANVNALTVVTSAVPEPTTIALCGLAVTGAAGAGWKRRQQKAGQARAARAFARNG